MAPPCLFVRTLLLLFMFSHKGTGQFHVVGPKAPIVALVGEAAVLPCHLSPSMDAQHMEVRWYRDNPSGLVHQYNTFQEDMRQQRPEYRGRTEFQRENISTGHVALAIHHIRPSDEGQYSCLFGSSTFFEEARFQLLVTVSGTAPHINIDHGAHKGLELTCTSTGWYPEPEVQWKDLQGKLLAPASETKAPESNGLFHVETCVLLEDISEGSVTCYIRNPILSVEKEVHISLTDALFPRVSPWPVVLPVVAVLLLIGVILSVLLVRARKKKEKKKEENAELSRKYEKTGEWNEKLLRKYGEIQEQYGNLQEQYEKISNELDRGNFLGEDGLNELRRFAEDIKLDTATAHPYLYVTQDEKYVESLPEKRDVPDNPEGFDTMVAVLGQNSFQGGRHYWEVGVAGKSRWTIGLCWDSVNRKGQHISACPENGFWTLCKKNGVYKALSTPRHQLNIPEPLITVGIFLKYEEGLIFFYNVTQCTILFKFKSNFTKPLKPYFYPGPPSKGNCTGLTIL
ncbi:butyrophilin subfamily 2 member A1-like isoform X1 [Choloepus didactylus]|uniref:butyrophilin subfamily 2 member A1-like isoform X1 n=1 Tax=Choloepus didactylus TaxID=27675 RepID=UPI00189CED8B|nr:butyrophilin subfamily 2 member A1-like isoform X1 [Choloepus didactylus]